MWLVNNIKNSNQLKINKLEFYFVGMTGFEPAAPTTLKWCANRTAPHPEKIISYLVPQTYFNKRSIKNAPH